MMRRAATIAALALALGIAPRAPARAAPTADEAEYVRDVVGRAAAHVERGRFEPALAVLDEAERTRPLPVFVYVRATIEERRGDCARAVSLYRRFLELDVADEDAEDARRGMTRCGEGPAPPVDEAMPADPRDVDPTPAPAASSSPDTPPATPPRPWWTDPLGGALVATGVVGVGTGAALLGQSRADVRAASDATSLQRFDDRSRRALVLDRAGIVTIAIGSALLLGGAVRWAVVGTRFRRHAIAQRLGPGLLVRF
jgi:hypothetical protein